MQVIELKPQTDKPANRTGFQIPDLKAHVRKHRADLVRSLLILVKWWVQEGRQPPRALAIGAQAGKPVANIGTFENYVAVIGGIIAAVGLATWQGNFGVLEEVGADDEEEDVRDLIDAIAKRGLGALLSTSEICDLADTEGLELRVRKNQQDGGYMPKPMSFFLKTFNGRVFRLQNGSCVTFVRHDKKGNAGFPWKLLPTVETPPKSDRKAVDAPSMGEDETVETPSETVVPMPATPQRSVLLELAAAQARENRPQAAN